MASYKIQWGGLRQKENKERRTEMFKVTPLDGWNSYPSQFLDLGLIWGLNPDCPQTKLSIILTVYDVVLLLFWKAANLQNAIDQILKLRMLLRSGQKFLILQLVGEGHVSMQTLEQYSEPCAQQSTPTSNS